MDIKKVDQEFSVSPQILPSDLPAIAAAGFKTVICNRPDGEGDDQPLFPEIEEAAKAEGLSARYLPVESGKVTDAEAKAFGEILDSVAKPVLAYCRTGTRSVTLWALSRGEKVGVSDVLRRAEAAGYDMSGVSRRLAAKDGDGGAATGSSTPGA